jgi:hypothetical protein
MFFLSLPPAPLGFARICQGGVRCGRQRGRELCGAVADRDPCRWLLSVPTALQVPGPAAHHHHGRERPIRVCSRAASPKVACGPLHQRSFLSDRGTGTWPSPRNPQASHTSTLGQAPCRPINGRSQVPSGLSDQSMPAARRVQWGIVIPHARYIVQDSTRLARACRWLLRFCRKQQQQQQQQEITSPTRPFARRSLAPLGLCPPTSSTWAPPQPRAQPGGFCHRHPLSRHGALPCLPGGLATRDPPTSV